MSMKLLLAVMTIILSTQISGCSKISGCSAFITSLYSPTGKSRIPVGEVAVQRSSVPSVDSSDATLIVSADEIGNAIISAGKGKLEMTPLALNHKDRNEAIEILNDLAKYGVTAHQEKLEMSKYVGSLSSDMGLLHGSAIIGIDFISLSEGKAWMGKMNFCYFDLRVIGARKEIGASNCDKEFDIYISPSSTAELLTLLEKVPQFTDKAKHVQSKE